MASRKRQRSLLTNLKKNGSKSSQRRDRDLRRRGLLETLENRQMLAGPQLIGIQPNEGALITDGTVRDVSPRLLTFRFDQDQQIDPSTLDAIQITRAGDDGQLGTADDLAVPVGSINVGNPDQNEVLVRFANALPDDRYRIEVFAFDDATNGITGLRNLDPNGVSGELLVPSDPSTRKEQVDFELDLGALVEAIVPQPVVRLSDGSLQQRRDQVVVYFNEDPLFVEDDGNGNPTPRSAENPRFYQLLYTKDTVRTTDDELYFPARVEYDEANFTATLFFEDGGGNPVDLNDLAVGSPGGGTFRMRIGTAVDTRTDLIVTPNRTSLPNGTAGDTFSTSYDVGALGTAGAPLSSLTVSESIDPTPFRIELPGGNDDPGHRELPESVGGGFEQHINDRFGADTTDGVTTVSYNFQNVYATLGNSSLVNQISAEQRDLIRQALSLWANYIGVQFIETADQGVTFALGDDGALRGLSGVIEQPTLDFSARVDEDFVDSTLVLSSQRGWNLNYGEDFFRTSMAGIGILLGLEYADDLSETTLLKLSTAFLNGSIDQTFPENGRPNEPIFPGSNDILHGRHLFRPDSNDIDMYRFQIDLDDADRTGSFTAETFAERLADASLLDTTLTLYQETKAAVVSDFNVGTDLSVTFTANAEGALGNRTRIDVIRTDRAGGDLTVRIRSTGPNSFQIDVPRQNPSTGTPAVTIGSVVDAINSDPVSAALVTAEITVGDPSIDIGGASLNYSPLIFSGGGMEKLARNDDYFSEDSLLRATLGSGTYYIGVAASGNDNYDPNIPHSGYGGRTQGEYDLQLKFEAQVDEVDIIRDRDGTRQGVPGTSLDGDGDGVPGGEHNFWFQTRPLNRMLEFNADGGAITPGQTVTVTGAGGVVRTFEFVPTGSNARPGNIPVSYQNGGLGGIVDPVQALAQKLAQAINSRTSETGVRAFTSASSVRLVGEQSIELSQDFVGAEVFGRTIFVDKTAAVVADGTLQRPFNNIANPDVPNAFGAATDFDIVRIVGNGGQDQKIETAADNFSYQIGTDETFGLPLEDGRTLDVPRNVTVMIDAGAAFKMRASRIGVGSSTLQVDRSGGVLQVLGTPRLLDADGNTVSDDGDVVFTSRRDRTVDAAAAGNRPAPTPGNWGGIVFRKDLDDAEGRENLENEGIFLQYVNHADIRYGGSGNLLVDSIQRVINPIQIIDVRPTVTFNTITFSADAAMSAAPDSFEETSFQSPRFQQAGAFTSDYDRVGPNINNNELANNSINGMFVRVETASNLPLETLTVAGRLDDIDIVHYVAENIVIEGTPGGPVVESTRPRLDLVTGRVAGGGSLPAGTYDYRMTFVDANGFETLASNPSGSFTVPSNGGTILLAGLPPVEGSFQFRRLYRLDPSSGDYLLVDELNASDQRFIDTGRTTAGRLDLTRAGVRGRLDASLVVDPGTVVKLSGARIELGQGTQLLAEGLAGQKVVFSSAFDDRYGAGGSFDTNNDNNAPGGETTPSVGNWSGIYAGPTAHVSLDNAIIAFGGGISNIEGTSRGFNAIELQQASARITNTVFEQNDDGQDGAGPSGRFGRLAVTPATIFVRGSQPVIVGNTFIDNTGSAIDIDLNSLSEAYVVDAGRQTGRIMRLEGLDDNHGPLVRRNALDNNGINGMEIRAGDLINAGVWDDTDIVHVLYDSVVVGNLHSSGGLRLKSRPDESLVIKLSGEGSPFDPNSGTGFTATGSASDIVDRIGGSIQILGLPGAPVVMTSLADDTVGAGLQPNGSAQTDTNNDRHNTRPNPNDWRSVLLDQYSQDRNVASMLELESATSLAPGRNAATARAQVLGTLAGSVAESNENSRLGFDVEGFLSAPNDVDTYSFTGKAGTAVWIDLDHSSFTLDSVIELLDSNGNVLARSDNSFDEVADPSQLTVRSPQVDGRIGSLQSGAIEFAEFGAGGLYEDYGSTNPRDAGMRVSLPGASGTQSVYFFRVRSASVAPDDTNGGLTGGGYRFQVRLEEAQEFAGSTVKYSDIRYSNVGVHVRGLPGDSPLLGEAQEDEAEAGFAARNDSLTTNPTAPGQRAQYLGNLLVSDQPYVSVGGELSSGGDVDFFQFDVNYQGIRDRNGFRQMSTVFDVDYADGLSRPDTNISVFYDADGQSGPGQAQLVLFGAQSNIAEDQSSPLAAEVAEILDRGSIRPGDPFIGPVSLPEGTYFVAITNTNQIPAQLVGNTAARREPVNSVRRVVDDHIDSIGGATADQPVVLNFIDQDSLPAGWEVTTLLSGQSGHGLYDSFDQTRDGVTFSNATQLDIEPNNTLGQAQNVDAIGNWSLQFNPDIGDAVANTSTTIPHTTVTGAVNDEADVFRFQVTADGTRMIFDVDDASNFSINDLDGKLWLLDSTGAIIQQNTVSSSSNGAGGSISGLDPYIEATLDIGVYYIALTDFAATYDANSQTFTDNTTFFNGPYTLHISQEGHAADSGPAGNASLRFDAANGSGSVRSATFDLSGYSENDQPYLYFNYLLDDANADSVNVRVVDAGGNSTLVARSVGAFSQINGNGIWNQARISLADFAGQDGLKVEFEYLDGGGGGNLGLFLDDFIIGFAERGELIVGATPGDSRFVTSGAAGTESSGEYQLEMRPGTNYVQASPTGQSAQTLVRSFDTNDRHGEHITLLAFEGNQLSDGDTFLLNDGGREVIFEFDDLDNGPSGVELGNIRIPFRQSDPANVIATAMRDAINNPAVQSSLGIEAAAADGSDTGLMTDNRINLSGSVQADLYDGTKQPISISLSNSGDALAANLVDGSISVTGTASLTSGVDSAGTFSNGSSTIQLDSGVVLSTGSLSTASGPNVDDGSGGVASGVGNADTDVVSGGTSVDSTSITLPFQLAGSTSSHIYLQTVFASEEYRDEIPGQPDGISVVLVDTLTGDETELALLPTGEAVSSGTINSTTRADQFNNNDPFQGGDFLRQIGFDGFTDRLVFSSENLTAPLVAGRDYELRIAVADNDASVNTLDSALFIAANSLSTTRPGAGKARTNPTTGRLVLPAIIHDGLGDTNIQRAQSQIIIDSNRISDVRAIGVWSEPGDRATDPEDFRANNGFFGTSQNPFLQLPPIHSTLPGAVRNLPTLNDDVLGGLAPGVVVVNNVIDQAGYAGVQVEGETRPFVLFGQGSEGLADIEEGTNFGDRIPDGLTFAIDAGGTRVVFEFEDISGSPAPGADIGSGVIGGDGWTDGHVPVYYRRDSGGTYNPNAPAPNRNFAMTSAEVMHSIHDSIMGSILVTNGLVQLVKPYVAPSYFDAEPLLEEFSTHNLDVPHTALYLDGISNIYFTNFYAKANGNPFGVQQAPVHEAAQPFARIVNNTIYGADGTESLFPEEGTREGNDTLTTAVDTKQGVAHTGPYTSFGTIGDNVNPLPGVGDVDFYQFELGSGDRAVIDIDTPDTSPQNYLGIDFPQGASSFADRVVLYDPLAGGEPPATAGTDPAAVIGPPQGTLQDSLSLSEGGVVVVEFTDNALVADGTTAPDLHIFETGSNIEPTFVEISVDGVNFISVGRVDGATSSLDIDQFSAVDPNALYRFVRITDDVNDQQPAIGVFGADIDAVGAISSRALPLDTVLQVFNSRGEVVASNDNGSAPAHLEATVPGEPGYDPDVPNPRDPFIDYTATEPGTYYVGVSSKGNEGYDPFSLGNRTPATGGRGNYELALEVLAPRTFVMNFNDGANLSNLVGTTFTVTQVPDVAGGTTNDITFEFTGPTAGRRLGNGNIRIPIRDEPDYRVPDVMRAISDAINGTLNDPSIPNHEFGNGPEGLDGPIKRATAMALGGEDGDDVGLFNFDEIGTRFHVICSCGVDLQDGFGHDRTNQVGSTGINGTTTGGNGTTELYVFLEGAAKVELSPEAVAAGLGLDPQPGTNYDQLLPETGIMVLQGASPSILNNLILNTHEGIVREETRAVGFGRQGTDLHPKPMDVIVSGTIFQHNGGTTPQFRDRIAWPVNPPGTGLTTSREGGTSNVNGGSDDFNQTLAGDATLLINPAGDDFLPTPASPAIDSAINSLSERDAFAALKQAIGISVSNLLAPERDLSGQLRVDDPDVAPPGGQGGFVFKDRGALDRADFVGPVAQAERPVDNAADGADRDPAVSFIRLTDGTYAEFQIKLQDTGDTANPFVGTGIDDTTVVGPAKAGVRKPGAALTLFENDRLLVEGIDYTFNYDTTENLIVLKPLAGIWKDDRSYRIALNNRDRFVIVSPSAPNTADGDQFLVTDSAGGQLAFEFEAGYDVELPEALTISIPVAGTGTGGISDGDRFTLNDALNLPVTFEFDLEDENLVLPGNVRVPFAAGATREELAAAVATAVANAGLDVTVVQQGTQVVLGSEAGATLETTNSGLEQAANTLTFRAPSAGAGTGGIVDGNTFIISDGEKSVTFEFETANGVRTRNVAVPVTNASTAGLVIDAMFTAIASTDLNVSPIIANDLLILDLPSAGTASVGPGQLRLLGLSRTPADATTLTFTPTDGGPTTTFELNRTDTAINNGVTAGNIGIDFTRDLTADQLAERIGQAINGETIVGLDSAAVRPIGGGILSVGGTPGLGLATNGSTSVEVVGAPGVTGPTSLAITGPLLLQVPTLGGLSINDGTQFTITNNGITTTFEYNLSFTNPTDPNAVVIPYNQNDLAGDIATQTALAITNSGLGITATASASMPGVVELGDLQASQIDTSGTPLTVRRGTVSDGEQLTITQQGVTLTFEFDNVVSGGGVTPGAIPVPFQEGGTLDDVALALAAAINNNRGNLSLNAVPEGNGVISLNDVPGTTTNAINAASVTVSGVPGGAIEVRYDRSFTPAQMKRALLDALNNVNIPGQPAFTTLSASDRGGDTIFAENVVAIGPDIENYFLRGIADEAENLLRPNREDNSTQFSILMPAVGLDFGDAPDPLSGVRGRYPTLFDVDGARHVLGDGPLLGSLVDADRDGQPNPGADGDDTSVEIIDTPTAGPTFAATDQAGFVEIEIAANPVDGETITLDTGTARATFEFDDDGLFDEDNFAVSVQSGETPADAFARAVAESPLRPAGVESAGNIFRFIVDDEDGVVFSTASNPGGVFNKNFFTPIDVTVTGTGVVEAWIDFNGDGDWTDPGEQIITPDTPGAVFADADGSQPLRFNVTVPATAPTLNSPLDTYARFRVSRDGGLRPTGLALSGEVEDYQVRILPGAPPSVDPAGTPDGNQTKSYNVLEGATLQVFDADGGLTATPNDNGLLFDIVDPNADPIRIVDEDLQSRRLEDANGNGGLLEISPDGTFSFTPDPLTDDVDFFGELTFEVRVTDVRQTGQEDQQLVSPNSITVTINVQPVNDPPVSTTATPPTITINAIEDEPILISGDSLIDGLFVPGPANEFNQELFVDTVGFKPNPGASLVPFQTRLGGSLQILADGSVRYTPPADYNGPAPDEFLYTVADVPLGAGEISQTSDVSGTVTINFTGENDPPIVGNDTYLSNEDEPFVIPLQGQVIGGQQVDGILDNDLPGPADEVAVGQTVSLVTQVNGVNVFPLTTDLGGTVTYSAANGGRLTYTPAANFSGNDRFTYQVTDSLGATSTGTVFLNVGGDNDAARFVGVEGQAGVNSITLTESKSQATQVTYDLGSWFSDPEGDPLIFEVTSDDTEVAQVQVVDNELTLTLPPFGFGQTVLRVRAINAPATPGGPNGPATDVNIPLTVTNTADPPMVIGTLDPLLGAEDNQIPAGSGAVDVRNIDLSTIFRDPDQTQLNYRVVSPTSFANSDLIESIQFPAGTDQMRINLRPNASGSIDLTIAASDGTFEVTESFTLTVLSVEDAPTGVNDNYVVPVGGRLSVLDPANGLLANDSDPDGDNFTVDVDQIVGPSRGTLTVNEDGTFVYLNDEGGTVGESDQFTYRLRDPSGLSDPITVTLTFGRSEYQNPIDGLNADVTADGFVTAIDALRVINLFNRRGSLSVPVSELTSAPPDFYDVNGDGVINPTDALGVINVMNQRSRPSGEGEGSVIDPRVASTVGYAAVDPVNLPQANVAFPQHETAPQPDAGELEEEAGWEAEFTVVDNRIDAAIDALPREDTGSVSRDDADKATDRALFELFDEITLERP